MRTLAVNSFSVLGAGAIEISAGHALDSRLGLLTQEGMPLLDSGVHRRGFFLAVVTLVLRGAGVELVVDPTIQTWPWRLSSLRSASASMETRCGEEALPWQVCSRCLQWARSPRMQQV